MSQQTPKKQVRKATAAFGSKNRNHLIATYFDEQGAVTPGDAWRHVYRLLLWIDETTGLAHCYESDKSQPGKPWYPRSLAFHDWLSQSLRSQPEGLGETLDWLFRRATQDLAEHLLRVQTRTTEKAKKQRELYEGRGFPVPGEDPELVSIVMEVMDGYLAGQVPNEKWRELVQRIRQHVTLENKRKNLVGEGFEDVVAAAVTRIVPAAQFEIAPRRVLQTVPGFENEKKGEKPNKVDIVLLSHSGDRRVLITAKWSIRADREKQFAAEFSSYVAAKSDIRPFEYVLVTNEFDPARLVRACEAMVTNSYMFDRVVHISTDALIATYGANPEDSMRRVVELVKGGRLWSLDQWISSLAAQASS